MKELPVKIKEFDMSKISWTALVQDQNTATDIDGASGKYCLGVLSIQWWC